MTDVTGGALTFEQAVESLEGIVAEMEGGQLPLAECLAKFERAIALSRFCSQQLSDAETRIQTLTEEAGLQPLERLPWEAES
jgi:exodeoxyribonuclease VII small subunit